MSPLPEPRQALLLGAWRARRDGENGGRREGKRRLEIFFQGFAMPPRLSPEAVKNWSNTDFYQ
jgi:hypothetical protein